MFYYVVGVENGTRITYSPAFVYRWEAQEWMEDFKRANARHWTANKRNVRCEIESGRTSSLETKHYRPAELLARQFPFWESHRAIAI